MSEIETMQFQLIATISMGLEAVLKHELQDLGFAEIQSENGRVRFKADARGICRANLWLRSADRVLLEVGNFPARNFDQLFAGTEELPWENYIDKTAVIPVTGRSTNSEINSVRSGQGLIKKAIIKRLQSVWKTQGNLPESGAVHAVFFHVERDQVSIALDTSGEGLHRRGYRLAAGVAPLRENVAAALIQLTRWNPDYPLRDPLCGSGTICLEAAMIGSHMAPGRKRGFAAEKFIFIDPSCWVEARAEVEDLFQPARKLAIAGSDLDGDVIQTARENLARLGLEPQVHLARQDADRLELAGDRGWLISNPPWGERMADMGSVNKLYPLFGRLFKRTPGWSFHFLTGDESFEQRFGERASKRRKVYNGNIQTRFLQYIHPRSVNR